MQKCKHKVKFTIKRTHSMIEFKLKKNNRQYNVLCGIYFAISKYIQMKSFRV